MYWVLLLAGFFWLALKVKSKNSMSMNNWFFKILPENQKEGDCCWHCHNTAHYPNYERKPSRGPELPFILIYPATELKTGFKFVPLLTWSDTQILWGQTPGPGSSPLRDKWPSAEVCPHTCRSSCQRSWYSDPAWHMRSVVMRYSLCVPGARMCCDHHSTRRPLPSQEAPGKWLSSLEDQRRSLDSRTGGHTAWTGDKTQPALKQENASLIEKITTHKNPPSPNIVMADFIIPSPKYFGQGSSNSCSCHKEFKLKVTCLRIVVCVEMTVTILNT